MTGEAKPVLNIDIDTSSFDAFLKTYQKYQASLADAPAAWGKVNEAAGKTADLTDDMTAALKSHLDAMQLAGAKEKSIVEPVVAIGLPSWAAMAHFGGSLKNNVQSATASLAKWAGLTAVFSTIMSAGGLYGIDRTASGVSGARATASGFGNSYGEQASFEANFSRLGNAGANLDWINSIQRDQEQGWKLQAITGSQGEAERLRGEDPAKAFAELLPTLKARVDKFPKQNFLNAAAAYGIPPELAIIISQMSTEEISTIVRNYRSAENPLGLSPATLRKWNDLNNAFETAGAKLSAAFQNQIVKLAPGVSALTSTMTHVITYVMRDGGAIDKALRLAGSGLQAFADNVNNSGFLDHVGVLLSASYALLKSVSEIVAHPIDGLAERLLRASGAEPNKVVSAAEAGAGMVILGAGNVLGGIGSLGSSAFNWLDNNFMPLYNYPVGGKAREGLVGAWNWMNAPMPASVDSNSLAWRGSAAVAGAGSAAMRIGGSGLTSFAPGDDATQTATLATRLSGEQPQGDGPTYIGATPNTIVSQQRAAQPNVRMQVPYGMNVGVSTLENAGVTP